MHLYRFPRVVGLSLSNIANRCPRMLGTRSLKLGPSRYMGIILFY